MPEFTYKAIKGRSQVVQGVLAAAAEPELMAELRRMGLLPIKVTLKNKARPWSLRALSKNRLSSRDRLEFARQLSTLVRAGLPLDRSLTLCRDLAEKESLRDVVQIVSTELRSGKSLAASLEAAGELFPALYVAMVRAGEASGTLPSVLDRLVEFEEFSSELRDYIISALIYPALLVTVGGAAVALLLGYVVPRFAQVFSESGKSLPLPTWVLMQVADAFRNYGWLAVLVLGASAWLVNQWIRTDSGRLLWDRWKLKAPLIGPVILKLEVGRLAKTMGTLLNQTVPIVSALRLTRNVLSNRILANAIDQIVQGVKRGQGFSVPLKAVGLFPPLMVQLTSLGEQTGKLDAMLLQISEIYDKEVRTATKRLVALIEPAIILVMGLVVGSIVVSTLLAIVSINEVPF
ncbi:MAG TPA: type II secretion system F family protein [Terriglobia bacterium]|nr:type II secretion system F family protein [Terriglobia bacterium]